MHPGWDECTSLYFIQRDARIVWIGALTQGTQEDRRSVNVPGVGTSQRGRWRDRQEGNLVGEEDDRRQVREEDEDEGRQREHRHEVEVDGFGESGDHRECGVDVVAREVWRVTRSEEEEVP